MIPGLDVSNYSDLPRLLQQFPRTRHVVVRVGLANEPPALAAQAEQQCRATLAAGRSLGLYVWCYRSYPPERTVAEAVALARKVGVEPLVWLDLETYGSPVSDPGPDAAWLQQAVAAGEASGARLGLYTARWWVDGYFPGGLAAFAAFARLPLWVAQYDGQADLATVEPAWRQAGFTVAGKQFSGDPDLDVFDERVVEASPPAAPDDTAGLRQAIAYLVDDLIVAPLGKPSLSRKQKDTLIAEAKRVRSQYV